MSYRKRKRAQVEVEDDENDENLAENTKADDQKDQAEKEQEVWEAIREERYEIVEQLPLTLHRQLSLMQQLDEQYQGYVGRLLPTLKNYIQLRTAVAQASLDGQQHDTNKQELKEAFTLVSPANLPMPRERMRTPQTSREHLSHVAWLSEELLRSSQEKVNLAQATADSVDRHIRLLDMAIQEQEASLISSAQGTIHLPDLTLPKPTRQTAHGLDKFNSITLQTSGLSHEKVDEEVIDSPLEEMGIPREVLKAMFVSPMKNEAGEELYCYCNRVSFGEMIACDGPQCSLEWFHLGCVGLTEPPEGEWYCENCTKFTV
ncbi:hypothetical protein BKA70DRAFT_1087832 [Coprinopsis sp. MPI-PUGE-AT-0042]|nr:hypothetical protein BKA70DRAFT_1087832 [Coprinopsis sp. MPI-PUGE-AT-0042]